jgi:hypothetical protein
MNVYHFNSAVADPDEPISVDKSRKWEASLDEPGALDMQHLFHLMTSIANGPFLDRIPDQELVEGDQGGMDGNEGIRSSRIQATRGRKGDYAMVYSANGRSISLRMNRLSGPRVNAFWFNPRSGMWRAEDRDHTDRKPFMKDIPCGPDAPIQDFDPPGTVRDGNDWVLLLN